MTKRLEELFGLDDDDEQSLSTPILPTEPNEEPVSSAVPRPSAGTLAAIEKVENALPQVRGLDSSDAELDELSSLAKEAFNNLMDLGMQVDSRFSAEIFNSASSMLGHAITTKTAKVNKKLRMIDLQLKQAELHRKLNTAAAKPAHPTDEKLPLGTGSVLNRDELIKMILNQNSTDANNSDKKDK
jgi:hypothetical protein